MKRNKVCYVLIVSVLCVFLLSSKVKAITPISEPSIQGVDVSNWQGYINYTDVKNSGIEIVYIKASQGTGYKDPYFDINYENAKANGLKVGFYHFLTATTVADAELEAQFFASVISGKVPDCRLVMDFEVFDGLSNSEINEISFAFLNRLKELTDKKLAIYSDLSNAQYTFSRELAEQYPLWLAYYGDYNKISDISTNWNNWIGLQYADNGEVNGIRGFTDRDIYTEEIFLSEVSQSPSIDKPVVESSEITYIVKSGDTLSKIALEYNTTVKEIVSLNSIKNPNLIFPGEKLTIKTSNNGRFDNISSSEIINYRVQKGDTLWSISRRYSTSIEEIVSINNIQNPNLIFPGENLKIVTNSNFNLLGETNQVNYTIQRGDTLSGLAKRFNTTVSEIVRLNNIQNPNLIFAGETLRIPN